MHDIFKWILEEKEFSQFHLEVLINQMVEEVNSIRLEKSSILSSS